MRLDEYPGAVPPHLVALHVAEHGHSLRIPEHVRRPQDAHPLQHIPAARQPIQLFQHISLACGVLAHVPATVKLVICLVWTNRISLIFKN